MNVKERIRIFIKHEGLTVSAFEKQIGASNGYVNSIRKAVSNKKLNEILEHFPSLNTEWLLTGRGEMLKSANRETFDSDLSNINHRSSLVGSGIQVLELSNNQYLITMPLVDANSRGQYGLNYKNADFLTQLPTHTIITDKPLEGKCIAWVIIDDAMNSRDERAIRAGAEVATNVIDRSEFISKDFNQLKYWVLVHKSEPIFCQVRKISDDGKTIYCQLLNPAPQYQDFSVQIDDVLEFGYAIKVSQNPI